MPDVFVRTEHRKKQENKPICKGVEQLPSMNLNLKVGDPQQKNNIVVFFLSSDEKKNDSYLSFFQALDQKLVDVSEVNERGFVNKLKVTNKSSQSLLILGGEQILGNKIKQHRIVATTVLIPSNATVFINVNCGEQYRWSALLNSNVDISETLYFSRGNLGKQYKIWNEIKNISDELRVKSFTSSVEEIYKKRKNDIQEIVSFFEPGTYDVGVAIGVNNQIKSLDVFSSNNHLKVYLKKIIRSVAINNFKKINHKSYLKIKDVHKFLRIINQSNKSQFKVEESTLGKRIHFNGETVNGTALYNENQVVHCSAFLKDILARRPEKEYNVA